MTQFSRISQQEAAASRIVGIQNALLGDLSFEERIRLSAEQRVLWDRFYEGLPYEAIAHDVWLVRRVDAYGALVPLKA